MSKRDTPVVILCGGRGMRLNEYTTLIPKPLVEIGGTPILRHIMRIYAKSGFRRFILCLGYRGELIRDHFLRSRERACDLTLHPGGEIEYGAEGVADHDWTVTLVDTGPDTETGGRLKLVSRYIDTETFFFTYGDGLSDLSMDELLRFHEQHGRVATMTCIRPKSQFGLVHMNSDGGIESYAEKPRMDELVNGGFFCLNHTVFDYIRGNEVFEDAPLARLIAARQLTGRVHDGFWASMDTFKDVESLNALWVRGDAPWKV